MTRGELRINANNRPILCVLAFLPREPAPVVAETSLPDLRLSGANPNSLENALQIKMTFSTTPAAWRHVRIRSLLSGISSNTDIRLSGPYMSARRRLTASGQLAVLSPEVESDKSFDRLTRRVSSGGRRSNGGVRRVERPRRCLARALFYLVQAVNLHSSNLVHVGGLGAAGRQKARRFESPGFRMPKSPCILIGTNAP